MIDEATQQAGSWDCMFPFVLIYRQKRWVRVLCNERRDKGKCRRLEGGVADDDGDDDDVQVEDHSSDEGGDGVEGSDMSSH